MTHENAHFAAHPAGPNDPPRPRPIGKPTPPPPGVFGLDLDGELTAEEETRRFLQLLPYCGLHGSPYLPRMSAAQLLEAENKIFYNV